MTTESSDTYIYCVVKNGRASDLGPMRPTVCVRPIAISTDLRALFATNPMGQKVKQVARGTRTFAPLRCILKVFWLPRFCCLRLLSCQIGWRLCRSVPVFDFACFVCLCWKLSCTETASRCVVSLRLLSVRHCVVLFRCGCCPFDLR